MIIAIDGPSASGKGTLAKRLAAHFQFAHLDTGKIYRAVALLLRRAGLNPSDESAALNAAKSLYPEILVEPDLTEDDVAQAASVVAAMEPVRQALKQFQIDFAHNPPGGASGAVLDGRDIGTVICPNAEIKLFVTADVEVRAKRRYKELRERQPTTIYARVLQDLKDRDDRDQNRSVAPLIPAADAYVLDTSSMDAENAFGAALEYVKTKISGSSTT